MIKMGGVDYWTGTISNIIYAHLEKFEALTHHQRIFQEFEVENHLQPD